MKTAFFILSLTLTSSATKAEDVILHRSHFGGVDRMDLLVSREDLRKVGPWEPGSGKDASLSRSQALEIAWKAAAAEGLDISDRSKLVINLTRTNPFEEDLIKRLPPGCCRWFYLVEFKGDDATLKGKFTFLVSMSGSIASKARGQGR